MIELDIDNFLDDYNSVLIVCYPTRVKYTAQAGGVGCTHPSAEGFLLIMQDFDIDDHSFGCLNLGRLPGKRQELAALIHDILTRETNGCIKQLEFDFSRVDDLQEGWWPIKIKANFGYCNSETFEGVGWLHNGNCD